MTVRSRRLRWEPMDTAQLIAQRVCADPDLAQARTAALAATRADWSETQTALRLNDRAGLVAQLQRSSPDQAAVAYASMHARVCPDCPQIEAILEAGGSALARQVLGWYGFWAGLRQRPVGPTVPEQLARWLSDVEPALLVRLPQALDALVTA